MDGVGTILFGVRNWITQSLIGTTMAEVSGLFQQARSSRLYESVVEQMEALIQTGGVQPGERLPSERDLATQFRVSRNVLREAFRILEHRGVIEVRAGDGRYVQASKNGSVDGKSDIREIFQNATPVEIFEAREMVEVHAAILAAGRISSAEAQRLREIAVQGDQWEDNVALHVPLAAGTHNIVLKRLTHELLEALQEPSRYPNPESARALILEHANIADAVAMGAGSPGRSPHENASRGNASQPGTPIEANCGEAP
jgi:DNA-binding FadR family transcriptional regulator